MGVAEPLALAFAGLYGVLVLFYLWERWRRRVVVPSLLLWEAVREDTLRARRFRPDLLFVLQLLLLTCLIVGLARPYVRDPTAPQSHGRHIFVLDTSASMQAREGRTSRFDEARAQALRLLRSLHTEDEVMLISTAPVPEVVVNFTRAHDVVMHAMEQAVPTDTGGDLALALMFADGARQRSDVPTEVDVFSDIPRSQLPPPVRDEVVVFQVGESDDNLGIEALQIFQGRFQDYRRARAYVLVQNFAHRERHGFLTVRLGEQVVKRSGFTIPARESKGFLIADFPGPGRVAAQLEVADALAADNAAFGWIRPVTAVRILVVSPPSPLLDDLRALATAAAALQVTTVAPEAFRNEQAQQADVVIFHRFVPDAPALTNALYVYPPAGNSVFPVAGDAEGIEVVDWNAHHAALQSLRPLVALPLQRARIVTTPAWSDVLLWSRTMEREFPLALAGERDGHRLACITYDLEAERLLGTDNVNALLFFMNLLGWLTPEDRAALVVQTGEVQTLTPVAGEPLRVQDPRGNTYPLPPAATATLQPLFAGEYRIFEDGTSRALLANFFDPIESDIGRASKEPPVVRATTQSGRASRSNAADALPHREYGMWLFWAAAVLFLIEWLVARRAPA